MTEGSLPTVRSFTHEGVEWVAWPSGGGAYGTGVFGPGTLDAVHFALGAVPEVPVYEALLPAGRFWGLFDDELIVIFRAAVRVVDSSLMPEAPVRRRTRSLEGGGNR